MKFKGFGNKIKKLREMKGMSQDELSKMTGISKVLIIGIENSIRAISFNEARVLSKALSISICELFSEDEQKDENSFNSAFSKTKNYTSEKEKEIRKIDLLFDSLCNQEDISKNS